MLPPPVVGQGQDREDAAPELVASYQSLSRELLGLHAARLRSGVLPSLLRSWPCPLGAARLIEERSGLLAQCPAPVLSLSGRSTAAKPPQ